MAPEQPQAYYMPAGEAVTVDDVNGKPGLEHLAELHAQYDHLPVEQQTKVIDITNADGSLGRCLARYVRVCDAEPTPEQAAPWVQEVRARMRAAGL